MMEFWVFVPYADQSLLKPWISKLRSLNMDCTPNPSVLISEQTGFFPFRLKFIDPKHEHLRELDVLTGFEFQVEDFSLEGELSKYSQNKGLLGKVLSKIGQKKFYASEKVDKTLSRCKKKIIIRYSSSDTFELRMAAFSALILAEITDGIASYPADNIWYDDVNALKDCEAEIEQYESQFSVQTLKFFPFESWL